MQGLKKSLRHDIFIFTVYIYFVDRIIFGGIIIMSLFSRLFHKDKTTDDQGKNQTNDRPRIETPFAVFVYTGSNEDEVGYEADINWYDIPEDVNERINYYPVGCYIDCNTPETTDASLCLERLTRLFEDRYNIDRKVKLETARHFSGENGLIKTNSGEKISIQELIDELEIRFISVYRDGRISYSMEHYSLDIEYGSDVHITFDKDGNSTVASDREFYNFT